MLVMMGITLAILGVLLVIAWRLPDAAPQVKRKKIKPEPAAEDKNAGAQVERLERKVKALDAAAQSAQQLLREREKYLEGLSAELSDLKKQLEQERLWNVKEEAAFKKEKETERKLKDELEQTRGLLNQELSERLRFEREVKELKALKEDLGGAKRNLSSRVLELERLQESSANELKRLRFENAELKKKKEDTEWVAKSDYKALEAELKRVRRELDERKKKQP